MPTLPPLPTFPTIGGGQDVFYSRHEIVPRPLIVRAKGVRMWDEDGREYIDLSSGPVVSNIGHGNEAVAEAMARQALTVDYISVRQARSQPNLDLTARISALAGPGFERVCLTSGGSEANECALKFLRWRAVANGQPERAKIITCDPSYHGGTLATLAMSGDDDVVPMIDSMITPSIKVPAPLSYRPAANHTASTYARFCAEALETAILSVGPQNVLAFFIEPVGGLATGCNVPPPEYFRAIRDICTRHGVALVFDEVLCGTGRTGKFLAAHNWPDALPDLVVMAKGLGSGYTPLGATLIPARMADGLSQGTGFGVFHTYSANPISCATALAVLDEYQRLDVLANTRAMGAHLRDGLETLKSNSSVIGDIRGLGLVMAMELVTDKSSKAPFPPERPPIERLKLAGLKHGLLMYGRRTSKGKNGDWIMISPPMVISRGECDEVLARLTAAVKEFEREWRLAPDK